MISRQSPDKRSRAVTCERIAISPALAHANVRDEFGYRRESNRKRVSGRVYARRENVRNSSCGISERAVPRGLISDAHCRRSQTYYCNFISSAQYVNAKCAGHVAPSLLAPRRKRIVLRSAVSVSPQAAPRCCETYNTNEGKLHDSNMHAKI